jgi:6-pyruvoyltetrahydropterin/6-carboxytetrahydropterin synthase
MSKDKEHIIDYILEKTDIKKDHSSWKKQKSSKSYDSRKIKIDDVIHYCKICKKTWSNVAYWVDTRQWTKYPKNNIPTIGKNRKQCKQCKKKGENMNSEKYQSTKKIPLGSCAFRQSKAESHCRFLHGYLLSAKLWFECSALDKNNWVVDFGSLKDLKESMFNTFDHTTIISADDTCLEDFQKLEKKGIINLRIFENGVGIEKFAEYVFDHSNKYIRKQTDERCWVVKCEVWEHGANSGVYKR